MNAKYFEENKYEKYGTDELHDEANMLGRAITNNLMVEVADPQARKQNREANAYHAMIALCEAGLSRLDADVVERSREESAKRLKPIDPAEVSAALFAAVLGIK